MADPIVSLKVRVRTPAPEYVHIHQLAPNEWLVDGSESVISAQDVIERFQAMRTEDGDLLAKDALEARSGAQEGE